MPLGALLKPAKYLRADSSLLQLMEEELQSGAEPEAALPAMSKGPAVAPSACQDMTLSLRYQEPSILLPNDRDQVSMSSLRRFGNLV